MGLSVKPDWEKIELTENVVIEKPAPQKKVVPKVILDLIRFLVLLRISTIVKFASERGVFCCSASLRGADADGIQILLEKCPGSEKIQCKER